jgi:uncharacterized membrane protein
MSNSDQRLSRSGYHDEVGRLLDDLDADESMNLLADLGERLGEISEAEIANRLGSPDEFVDEYRTSAGIDSKAAIDIRPANLILNILSGLLLPFGVMVLLSFGGQLILGLVVVPLEWVLARISARPLRIAWSVLAGALVAEIAYLVLNTNVAAMHGPVAVLTGVAVGIPGGILIYRTASATQ